MRGGAEICRQFHLALEVTAVRSNDDAARVSRVFNQPIVAGAFAASDADVRKREDFVAAAN
jgi:hypothetical protein